MLKKLTNIIIIAVLTSMTAFFATQALADPQVYKYTCPNVPKGTILHDKQMVEDGWSFDMPYAAPGATFVYDGYPTGNAFVGGIFNKRTLYCAVKQTTHEQVYSFTKTVDKTQSCTISNVIPQLIFKCVTEVGPD